jgi:hypothetical protein
MKSTDALPLLLTWVLAAVAGCAGTPPARGVNCWLSSRSDLRRIHRVVLVELDGDGSAPQVARSLTESLFRALQSTRLFHVDVVAATDAVCLDLPLDKREPFTIEEMAAIRRQLRCDAVLLGRVSHYQPYPHMQLGLYLRLLDLRDGKLVWGVDHVWDTTDKAVEDRIRRFFDRQMRSGWEPEHWSLVLKSPRAFRRFVAYETAGTISPQT